MLALASLASLVGVQSASAMITSQLDIGSTGGDVTQLQSYLSETQNLYPSRLVTGYFGPLTQGGVKQFQITNGIVSSGSPSTTGFGRVGPITMVALNSAMGSGGSVSLNMSPILSNPNVQINSTNNNTGNATISWNTNVPTQGQVFYDTANLNSQEATGPRQQPYVSGTEQTDNSGQTNHVITLQNLQSNTTYYYLVRSVDSSGNMSMTNTFTFRTN